MPKHHITSMTKPPTADEAFYLHTEEEVHGGGMKDETQTEKMVKT